VLGLLGLRRIRNFQPIRAAVLVTAASVGAVGIGVPGTVGPGVAGAAVAAKQQSPSAWTERFCSGLVAWQAAALDARDVASPVVASAPADQAGVKAAALSLDGALKPPAKAIATVASDLERRTPRGKNGGAVGTALAGDVGKLADLYAAARERAVALKQATPTQFAKRAPLVLTKLDTDLTKAERPISKLDRRVAKSSIDAPLGATPACRRLGFEWSALDASSGTSPPSSADPATPGVNDVTAPAVLLPGNYRPSPEIAALAARTTMTGLGRLYFYAAQPQVLTGPAFTSSCPAAEASTQQILGCYRNHRIYLLNVTRAELITVPDVTAAHEMLHAVYEEMDSEGHAAIDPKLSALYDTTEDVHIKRLVPLYQQRTPLAVPNELHSLIGTQVGTLTPELDTYFGQYFQDRSKIVGAYVAYISVFDNLLNRYHELDVQLTDLRDQINGLRGQAQAAGAEAQRLGSQIDALRAQGRVAESNALVGPQNAAARNANGLVAQANGLIDQYNALVAEINGIAAQLGGLDSALRPL
jgi:hypothetical protein